MSYCLRTYPLPPMPELKDTALLCDAVKVLNGKTWIAVNNSEEIDIFTFELNNQLIISKADQEYVTYWNYNKEEKNITLKIDNHNVFLFEPAFIDENLILLQESSNGEYLILQDIIKHTLNPISKIEDARKYIESKAEQVIIKESNNNDDDQSIKGKKKKRCFISQEDKELYIFILKLFPIIIIGALVIIVCGVFEINPIMLVIVVGYGFLFVLKEMLK